MLKRLSAASWREAKMFPWPRPACGGMFGSGRVSIPRVRSVRMKEQPPIATKHGGFVDCLTSEGIVRFEGIPSTIPRRGGGLDYPLIWYRVAD